VLLRHLPKEILLQAAKETIPGIKALQIPLENPMKL
jgi:hypothetical protein